MSISAFYNVEDVQRLLDGCSKSFAYSVIQQLNKELKGKGYITRAGRVPKKFFHERYYCDAPAPQDREA